MGQKLKNRLCSWVAGESSEGMRDNSFMECTSSAWGGRLSLGSRRQGGFIQFFKKEDKRKIASSGRRKKKKEEKHECSFISILKAHQANWPPVRLGHPALLSKQTHTPLEEGLVRRGASTGTGMGQAGCKSHHISSHGDPGLYGHPVCPSCHPESCCPSRGTLRLSGLLSYQKHFSHHNRDLQYCIKKMVNFLKLPFKHRNRIRRLTRSDASPLFDYV